MSKARDPLKELRHHIVRGMKRRNLTSYGDVEKATGVDRVTVWRIMVRGEDPRYSTSQRLLLALGDDQD